ncbi:alpha/beta hydrolase [Corynebacterium minutissimum]|uniref:Corynomycolyl transferase n=1 Tax=Corynebacterium minutissimum TaxID=38301 RepID=A0A2X4RFV7_9CORY|nr:alpha/beta hydrolase family protein [Corynebacterium minutissimum]MCG7230091.1 esterase family protein [Corynebacterium minutissimum]MCG7237465.1 esterase family protein [Corynebacterium minutissimum]QPS60217.1 esterase family protein [Corynebacterium minutissimum]QQA78993.1 esterase family protein [Corynebacterium minutissimum]SQI00951.1 corynomycolyl transferase [Corynebacterium minutissimum]
MKFARSLTTLAAASALALGAVSSPIASASDVTPEQIRGEATPSTISELDVYGEIEEYLPKNDAGQPVPSREEYEASIGKNVKFEDVNINKIPDEKQWLGFILKYADYRQNVKALNATAPAMDRQVPLAVVTPDGTFDSSRPTLYLLNGAGGAEQGMDWLVSTAGQDLDPNKDGIQDLDDYYGDRNVNVVIPQAGAFSYYTDWITSPNRGYLKGPQKWETFLTKELPGPLEEHINANGKRGIAGMSMSATSSLVLAQHNPNFYDAIGSYSGCAATSTPLPNFYSQLTVNRGGGSTTQMWGPKGGDYNRYNDGLINATKNNMGNSQVYVSANSGLAGATDMGSSKIDRLGSAQAFKSSSTLVIEGGVIEAAMNACTHDLRAKLNREGVDADFNFRETGTHSWPGWLDDINSSWPTFARAFDLPVEPVSGGTSDSALNAPADKDAATESEAEADAVENADVESDANAKADDADKQNTDKAKAEADPAAPADSLPVDSDTAPKVDPEATEQ